MENLFDLLFKDKEPEEMINMFVNFNRFNLNRKEHIKKYNKLRRLHGEILNSMSDYMKSGKYDMSCNNLKPEYDYYFNINLRDDDDDDVSILEELNFYNVNKDIPSLTKIYLEKRKFRNKEKVKLLESMNDSYVSLFKVVGTDVLNGYVTYLDVFSGKKYKIIDIAMSSTLKVNKKNPVYVYNRIITYDDIAFGTGIHIYFNGKNKELEDFIKKYRSKRCSDLVRCLILYVIAF